MNKLAVLTDSVLTVTEEPLICSECGAAARIARGNCVNCLLLEGVADEGESSSETFGSVLDEAHVPDQHWHLGNYEILGEIGRGGMGIIYRARQRHSQRIVAVKRILSFHSGSHERVQRFRREAEAAASLDHPNILPIFEVSESADGCPFFSMKWATGGSLREVGPSLRARPRESVQLIAKVARAIEFAHSQGILHRDLQPGNILLDSRGEPMVSDFGLVKWMGDESELTVTQSTFGTPGFIAPEQAEGSAADLTAAADIYGLGAVLFNLLAGRPPFLGANALTVLRQAAENDAPKLRTLAPELNRDLETIVSRCLERDPKARYRSAAELAEDLERWLDGRPIRARPVLPPAQLWRWSRRNPTLAATAAICLALGVAVISLLRSPAPSAPGVPVPDKSIAVLPFENLDHNPENAFFADGMQEDILADLSKVADLKVISRSSVRDYRPEKPRDLRAIASELGVRHLLEGSVRRSDGRVRISAHLTDTTTGAQLWAEQYDRDLPDVFAIQSEIAQRIASQLQARLSPKEAATIKAKPTIDMVAYELYLRAKEISERPGISTAERTKSQVELLDQAVTRDPAFVSALCLLSRVHVYSYWSNHDHTPARLEAARAALNSAARLQPDSGEVHLTRGIFHYWGYRDYIPALAELEQAGAVLPNDARVPYFIGLITRRQGDWNRSTRALEQSRMMDPRNDLVLFDLARTNYFAQKRYREAAETAESVLAWKPDAFDFHLARAKVDVASRADLGRWRAVAWGDVAKTAEPDLLAFERLELALAERDFAAAAAALATHKVPEFNWAGYVTPHDWYKGLIASGLGDSARAQASFAAARETVAALVAQRPDDAKAQIILAEIEARLGRKEEAIAAGERALSLRPVSKDAVDGPNIMCRLAGVYARIGDIAHALDLLEVAVGMPGATNFGALKIDETWDPLRANPRFDAIVAMLAPEAVSR
jgi:serine/threonine protein kinase/tetratricopeptide (TPR) repeat protein